MGCLPRLPRPPLPAPAAALEPALNPRRRREPACVHNVRSGTGLHIDSHAQPNASPPNRFCPLHLFLLPLPGPFKCPLVGGVPSRAWPRCAVPHVHSCTGWRHACKNVAWKQAAANGVPSGMQPCPAALSRGSTRGCHPASAATQLLAKHLQGRGPHGVAPQSLRYDEHAAAASSRLLALLGR